MPADYLEDTPFLNADRDGEFFITPDPGDASEGRWHRVTCDHWDCPRDAVFCEGATVLNPGPDADSMAAIIEDTDAGLDRKAKYWCLKHLPLVTGKDTNDEVTAALLEHKIDPYVVADISSRLDERLKGPRPIIIVKEPT